MSNSLMNTGVSGLNAAQNILNVVSNNISNAYTQGYNRQSILLSQMNGMNTPAGFIGNGVQVASVNRVYNEFVVSQLRDAQTESSSIAIIYQQMSKMDDLMADGDTSISKQLQNFFDGLSNLVSESHDPAARQSFLSNTNSLVNQFNITNKYLGDMEKNANRDIATNVEQINQYAERIAELNEKIVKAKGASGGNEPSALMDQRDQLVNELNQLVKVDVSEQNGSYNLTIANGLTLVQGGNSYELDVKPSAANPSVPAVIYKHPSGATSELNEKDFKGGALSGILEFRNGALQDARNRLGQIALSFADSFNQQHQQGIDLNGDPGKPMFSFSTPQAIANTKNQGNGDLTIRYDDTSKVQPSDYQVDFDGTNWTVTRLSDGTTLTPTMNGNTMSFDGLSIEISGTPAAGDKFTFNPVSDVASSLKVEISDPNEIATGLDDGDGGDSDNRNAKLLLALQDKKIVGGSASFNDAYASLVSKIGNDTQAVKVNAEAQINITNQLNQQNQSISGVNLDEEFISLQVYTQFYQANAQVIQTANSLFDSILSLR